LKKKEKRKVTKKKIEKENFIKKVKILMSFTVITKFFLSLSFLPVPFAGKK